MAWWIWALALVAAASRGTSPWLSLLIALGAVAVAGARRSPDAPPVLRLFLVIAGTAAVLRLAALVVLGSGTGSTTLLELPSFPVGAGLRIGGPVTLEALLSVGYTTLQLTAILACFAAASEFGPARRLLGHLPASLYEVGTAVTVALTCAPQMAEHARAVHTARRLRSPSTAGRLGEFTHLAAPVLDAALDRSLALAAAMECRGFSHSAGSVRTRRLETLAAMGALAAITAGTYGLLAMGGPSPATLALMGVGVSGLVVTLWRSGRAGRTRYRRDPWGTAEWLLVLGAVGAFLGATWSASAEAPLMNPTAGQQIPLPPAGACLGVLVALGCALAPVETTR